MSLGRLVAVQSLGALGFRVHCFWPTQGSGIAVCTEGFQAQGFPGFRVEGLWVKF